MQLHFRMVNIVMRLLINYRLLIDPPVKIVVVSNLNL